MTTTPTNTKQRSLVRNAVLDTVLIALACLIPSVSHLLGLPLRNLNPMLMLVVAGVLLSDNKWNTYLLALALPFVTSLISGMPSPLGALCMVLEYATVVTMLTLLLYTGRQTTKTFAVALAAMLTGKAVYYLAKWLIIRPDQLITTAVGWQVASLLVIALLFAIVWPKTNH